MNESLGQGWIRRYEKLTEQLESVVSAVDANDLIFVRGLEQDAYTGHYFVDDEYLRDYTRSFYIRWLYVFEGVAPHDCDDGDADHLSLKDNPLFTEMQKKLYPKFH